ncbi:aminoacyl-tRNA hydrolase [Agrobacterium rhizogenes]|uniref:aminoacyl-tRNA hydrolase n=1 Tax=Rhizobium rhizogenes TaxID=359 RepID=UPI000562C55C|nr:aminoacyl-tRNA hydrolase [Rhizobium rhizogenes]NTF81791.1 aminoacyl-tRNA hydrolase [Rhizobium rhizogenes]NTH77808.1 aminoacyl-tRNA hydrolase [Rhizobium rhizogenes]NTH83816.1 aminoacyl-tRNA hydrolase [Rhizobium rhizogenes]NTI62211.1 aminoacyl-tRNA hydrolase [Rhizobium rhizogenes]NTI75218.1 aminoacyl-tRNA hydrolase [Rhizobium rhizogenes]
MLLIVGLGNPGAKYQGNRHNIGFMAVDAIHRRHSFSPWTKKFRAEIAEGELGGQKVLLIKPQTFMNLSGESVGEAMRFYKLEPSDLVVIYDELDLPAAKARLKTGGGHGGHNGIKSIDAHCGREYRRLRLGIGHPGVKELVQNHVLGDFAKVDRDWLEPLFDAIADNADMLVRGEDSQLMNKIALALGGKAEEEAPKPEKKVVAKSHVHQARNHNQPRMPESGPMAEMLKRMFGKKDD